MNVKKAKQLRKIVRQAVVGKNVPRVEYIEVERNRKYQAVEKISGDGKSTYTDRVQVASGTMRLDPRSQRGMYQELKKAFKKTR